MASKQLGKLRQWAGEVMSSRDKTTVSDEFRDLEKDIELRKDGIHRLRVASEAYHHSLVKKKDSEVLDVPEKLLPLDALGMVMILHGEEFLEDSAFGTSLMNLGRAHCKIATLQEAYAVTFHETFLASVEKFGQDIKDYEMLRKKLESRRLSYDAAMSKLEKLKAGKKEKKEKKEAEEEVQKAKLRYEETSEDVRAQVHAIQENEIDQLRELTAFLDLEVNFVGQCLDVLKNVKSEWRDNSASKKFDVPRVDEPLHVFPRTTPGSQPNSVRSKASVRSSRSSVDEPSSSEESNSGEEESQHTPSRRPSLVGRKSTSRPSSRSDGKRSDSTAAAAAGGGSEREKGERLGRRLSVAGWASSAVGSVTGRSKKSRDNFAALIDGADDVGSGEEGGEFTQPSSFPSFKSKKATKSKEKESLGNRSPKASAKILKPPSLHDKKFVRALYDFTGTSDELSFKTGDEIVVVNEVLDEWWMGELDGRKGLFPTSYTERTRHIPTKQALSKEHRSKKSLSSPPSSSDDETSKRTSVDAMQDVFSDIEDEHLFRADHLAPARGPFYGHSDVASITSSSAEEDEERSSIPADEIRNSRRASSSRSSGDTRFLSSSAPSASSFTRQPAIDTAPKSSTTGKKPPPPPPPRRLTTSGVPGSPRVSDNKSALTFRTTSTPSVPMLTPSSSNSSHDNDRSPFESATDLGCDDFRQHPFKPKGMCSNCFASHV